MKISLKKAADIARSALTASTVKFENSASFSIYSSDDLAAKVSAANDAVNASIADATAMLALHFRIRGMIGEKNAEVGISRRMTERAELAARKKILQGATVSLERVRTDFSANNIDAANKRIAAMKVRAENATASSYGLEDSVTVGLISADTVKQWADQLDDIRLKDVELVDEIAGLNASTSITLSDDEVALLRKAKIIA